jgi:elongator complex protein 2
MAPASPSLYFASAGCNNVPGAMSALPTFRICLYASGTNIVALRIPKSPIAAPVVTAVLPAPAPVTAVSTCAEPVIVVAALSSGALAVARLRPDRSWSVVQPTSTAAHDGTPVSAVHAARDEHQSRTLVASAGMNGQLCLWSLPDDEMESSDSDDGPLRLLAATAMGPEHLLPECVAIALVHGKPMVVLGGTDRIVRMFQIGPMGDKLVPLNAGLLGHRDWIRGLTLAPCEDDGNGAEGYKDSFLLATSSTDATARVWKFQRVDNAVDTKGRAEIDDETDDKFGVVSEETRARTHVLIGDERWTIALEALLGEHNAAVHSVVFAQGARQPVLMTSSMDGSVALWTANRRGVDIVQWEATARFGLLGGAGAHLVGFSGAVFVTSGADRVIAHTLGGGLHSWRRTTSGPGIADVKCENDSIFVAESAPGGHVAPVSAITWDPSGRFLMSCSDDKTTRVYVETPRAIADGTSNFVEWARPQVHGYPIRDVAFLREDGAAFASASEEKVLRLFDAPSQFILPGSLQWLRDGEIDCCAQPQAATSAEVPELGLSNKPVYNRSNNDEQQLKPNTEKRNAIQYDDSLMTGFGAERAANSAPLEIELRQHRLWPERAKLYGHGNELSCVAVARPLNVLASASRAQSARDAAILLWDSVSGAEKQRLPLHDLTVTQLRFSPNSDALLSVSRDRSFAVFRLSSEGCFALAGRRTEAHARLLHAGCWLLGGQLIATGARDKYLKIFDGKSDDFTEMFKRKFHTGVSALDATESGNVMAIGLEDGSVLVERVVLSLATPPSVMLSPVAAVPKEAKCSMRVTSLAWRPCQPGDMLHLAVGSDDHAVRVYSFDLGTT